MLLNIEARIGQLIEEGRPAGQRERTPTGTMKADLPKGVNSDRSKNARAIHREMEKPGGGAVAAVIAEAKENEDIPTKTAVRCACYDPPYRRKIMEQDQRIVKLERDRKVLIEQYFALLEAVGNFFGSGPEPPVHLKTLDALFRSMKTTGDKVNEIKASP